MTRPSSSSFGPASERLETAPFVAAGEPERTERFKRLGTDPLELLLSRVDHYEDLDQPLDAITAMEAVVVHDPEVAEHRDRLAWMYRRAGAWAKAAAEFEKAGELATDDRGRAALRAAGRLYREHGQLDRAVEIYRAIVAKRATDDQAWRELDELLSGLGRWREVAEVRATRANGVIGIERAALLRSQARALEQSGELAAAAALTAEAAVHAPDDLSGLVDHAEILARGGRPAEAARLLRTRIAGELERDADPEHVAALRLRLVGVLDDDCDDRRLATAALDELLASMPEYLPALERAAAFAAGLDPRLHAAALLRYAAALPSPDPELLAAAARRLRDAGDHEAAVRQLERAEQLDAGFSVALEDARGALLVARNCDVIDNLIATGELDKAGGQIDRLLQRDDVPPNQTARLLQRQAAVQAQLGDVEESHRLLHEAHRLDRRDLSITLALGESCYERRLWREAARHLGSLADHPDAARRAAEVATGLVHAALSETRSLRPANATAHLDAAVRIDPACGPAWHALAEAAIERGDLAAAADCLEREATATPDLQHRVRLFDALGDMARDVLGDPARAARCWFQVVDLAEAPVLHKLLALQRKHGAPAERAHTCERLAELEPAERKTLREEAAQMFVAAGEIERAMAIAHQLASVHPLDLDVATTAADVAIAARDPRRVAGWLRRTLAAQHATHHAPRVAALWRKLGDAEQALGDAHAARSAYRRAVIVAPDSDAALVARRGLVDLAADQRSDTAVVALQSSLFALVEAEPDANDALALAHQLSSNKLEDARATYELARVLGAELSPDDEQFYADHPPRAMAPDEGYATRLEDAARRELIDDPEDGALAEIFELLGEVGSLICSDSRTALLDLDAERVPITGDVAAAAMLPQITKALGGPLTLLYASSRASRDVTAVLTAPPAIVLGPQLFALRVPSRSRLAPVDDATLRFELGRGVELARWRRIFAADRDELVRWVATLEAFAGRESSAGALRDAERLRSKLPVTHRKRLADKLASSTLDADAYYAACGRAADRAGLLACGDITIAVERGGGPDVARHLVSMAASRAYLGARRRLRNRDAEDMTARFTRP